MANNTKKTCKQQPGRKKTLAIAMSALLGSAQAADAQQLLEEIVVTATKREANLQDIPLVVTAFTTDDIVRRGFKTMDDYAKFIPGMALGQREPGGNSVVFRGVAASGIQFGANPSSGVYLDEQPITAAGINPDPQLVDIERVEALSGPQGTLFGDASQSGTLRIITNKPDLEAFDSWFEAGGAQVEHGDAGYDLSAMVNVPVSADQLAIRLVGFHSEEAGYIDNVLGPSGGGTFDNADYLEDDVNTTRTTGGRAAVRWTPDEIWTLDLSAAYQAYEADGFADTNIEAGGLEQVRFNREEMDEEWYQLGLTLEGSLGFADVVAHTSYFSRDFRYDADGTDYQFAFDELYDNDDSDIYNFGGDPDEGFAVNDIDNERWTVEARMSTPVVSDSKWFGLVGLFYNRTEETSIFAAGNGDFAGSPGFYYIAYNADFNNPAYIDYDGAIANPDYRETGGGSLNGLPPGSWETNNNWFFGAYDETIEQFALFGEMSFDFTEDFTITAGGRWFRVDREFELVQGALQQERLEPDYDSDFIVTDESVRKVDKGVAPKVSLAWRYNDSNMFYVTYSHGFRSGGGNGSKRTSGIPNEYDSDLLKNLEVGAKTAWLNERLRLNVNAYKMVWEDIQVQVEDPNPFVFSLGIVNFPEAEVDGFEIDLAWAPAPGWNLSGALAYNDAVISESASLDFLGYTLDVAEGSRLPITPDWKASLSAEYTFRQRALGAVPWLRFDFSHTGESVNALGGLEPIVSLDTDPPVTVQEPYQTGDLSMGLDAEVWSATFYIDNVWDERGVTFVNNRWAERRFGVIRPRTFGVTVRRSF